MISLAYYLRVVAAMWMRPGGEAAAARPAIAGASPEADPIDPDAGRRLYLVAPALLAAAGVVFFGVIPQPLVEFAEHAGAPSPVLRPGRVGQRADSGPGRGADPETAAASRGRPRPAAALDAATMCEAFQLTAAERAGEPALRLKDTDYEASFAEYAETVRRRAAGSPRSASGAATRSASCSSTGPPSSSPTPPRCTSAPPASRSTTPPRRSRSSTSSPTPRTG